MKLCKCLWKKIQKFGVLGTFLRLMFVLNHLYRLLIAVAANCVNLEDGRISDRLSINTNPDVGIN
ncbi:MAG: hypothetical protein KI793_16705 [Rivularia sp. (in: Bacteria)]|nr:hypothetical protein [Rivularia sp. MS3]